MKNDCTLTITNIAPLIKRKKLSPVELTEFFLDRLAKLQPSINAFITITAELALKQAKQAEKEIVKGNYRGALHGTPVNLSIAYAYENATPWHEVFPPDVLLA